MSAKYMCDVCGFETEWAQLTKLPQPSGEYRAVSFPGGWCRHEDPTDHKKQMDVCDTCERKRDAEYKRFLRPKYGAGAIYTVNKGPYR